MKIDIKTVIKMFSTRSCKDQLYTLQEWRGSILNISPDEQNEYIELLSIIQANANQQANWGSMRKNAKKKQRQDSWETWGPPFFRANPKFAKPNCLSCKITIEDKFYFGANGTYYHKDEMCFPTEYADKMKRNDRYLQWLNTGDYK
jgi:hypothetical protein